MKKLLCCILVFCMMSFSVFSTSAESFLREENLLATERLNAIDTANDFIKNVLKKEKYGRTIDLYDVNDKVGYMFFDLGDNGYVIVDIKENTVVEGSVQKNNLVDLSQKCYYNGPLNYYKKIGSSFVDLRTNEQFLVSSVQKKEAKASSVSSTSEITPMADGQYTVQISGTLTNYGNNNAGICGAIAASMYFDYYDNYVNDNYVDINFETNFSLLVSYIEGEFISGGTTPETLKNGMQSYVNSRGISKTIYSVNYLASTYKSVIGNNKPVIVGLTSNSSYGAHWVTGYGYYVKKAPSISYLIVNDGLGRTGVHINTGYVDALVY